MWHEITGGQIALLYEVQKAWVREMVEIRSRWRLGGIVKYIRNIHGDREVPQDTFNCRHCGRQVSAVAPGARLRSHCPHCLWSLHAGDAGHPGCSGGMAPVGVCLQADAWSVVHRCQRCSLTEVHPVAVDDNGAVLLSIAAGPARPRAALDSATTAPP